MTILSFEFKDRWHNWELEHFELGDFNLLVGISGVGKSLILSAIDTVRSAGIKDAFQANGCSWNITLQVGEKLYTWEAEVSFSPQINPSPNFTPSKGTDTNQPIFIKERIVDDSRVVVDRNENSFEYHGTRLPALKLTESAITLLYNEETIRPLHTALSRLIYNKLTPFLHFPVQIDYATISTLNEQYHDISRLETAISLPSILKGIILQSNFLDRFTIIRTIFLDIFPSVIDIGYTSIRNREQVSNQPPFE
ncbi:MAG: hypothetical protein HQL56_17160, partial [Magnetococcales bacterium]|nr:hypothetical protein [Magnetococcales bacterium]